MNPIVVQLESLCKTKKKLDRDYIEKEFIGSFMILRYVSFLDIDDELKAQLIKFINQMNYFYKFNSKYDEYLFLLNTLPTLPKTWFTYIKKPKKDKEDKTAKIVEFLCDRLELSKKEVKYLIDEGYVNTKQIEKILK